MSTFTPKAIIRPELQPVPPQEIPIVGIDQEFLLFGDNPQPPLTSGEARTEQSLAFERKVSLEIEELGMMSIALSSWSNRAQPQNLLLNPSNPDESGFCQMDVRDLAYPSRLGKIFAIEMERLESDSPQTRAVFKAVVKVPEVKIEEANEPELIKAGQFVEDEGADYMTQDYEQAVKGYLKKIRLNQLQKRLGLELHFPQAAYVSDPQFEGESIIFEYFRHYGMDQLQGAADGQWEIPPGYKLYLGEAEPLRKARAIFTWKKAGGIGIDSYAGAPTLSGHRV